MTGRHRVQIEIKPSRAPRLAHLRVAGWLLLTCLALAVFVLAGR